MASWDYSHRALIAGIDHSKPHDNVAWEIFYPEGPFALLPMLDGPDGQHRSALVWTVDEKDAAGVLKLSDRAFLAEVHKRMGDLLGELTLNSARSSWPLSFRWSKCSMKRCGSASIWAMRRCSRNTRNGAHSIR